MLGFLGRGFKSYRPSFQFWNLHFHEYFQLGISSKCDLKAENSSTLCKFHKGKRGLRPMGSNADLSASCDSPFVINRYWNCWPHHRFCSKRPSRSQDLPESFFASGKPGPLWLLWRSDQNCCGFFFLSFWLFDSAFETFRISCQFFHIGPFRFGFAWESNVLFGFNKKAALCKLTRLFKWRKRVKYFSKTDTTLSW